MLKQLKSALLAEALWTRYRRGDHCMSEQDVRRLIRLLLERPRGVSRDPRSTHSNAKATKQRGQTITRRIDP
ncbi:MAG: hypothetical protein KatS3mg109_0389 [Pirellulaceae bacterium]|nr:MAG: hypothetical protein KatS3mg109_0389 [Pirellulaceae bacterium]